MKFHVLELLVANGSLSPADAISVIKIGLTCAYYRDLGCENSGPIDKPEGARFEPVLSSGTGENIVISHNKRCYYTYNSGD